jgi:glucose-1-phosphate cytidylyltransferase
MKVVILCGGQGTRLREETEYRPKPMVHVGHRPILWHIMKGYAHHGFREFVLCLGYKGELIKEWFFDYEVLTNDVTVTLGKDHKVELHRREAVDDWKVTLADTGQDALTGARVKKVARYLDGDRFMLTYGDGVSNVDLKKLLEFHLAHGKIGTVTGVHPSARFGELELDGRRVTGFSEKPQVVDSYINGGFFIFERRFLDYLTEDDPCQLERAPLERLVADGQLQAYIHDGFWQCMDTFRDMKLLNDLWARGDAPWAVWQR